MSELVKGRKCFLFKMVPDGVRRRTDVRLWYLQYLEVSPHFKFAPHQFVPSNTASYFTGSHINTHTTQNSPICSDEWLTLETSTLKLFTVANLHCQLNWENQNHFVLPPYRRKTTVSLETNPLYNFAPECDIFWSSLRLSLVFSSYIGTHSTLRKRVEDLGEGEGELNWLRRNRSCLIWWGELVVLRWTSWGELTMELNLLKLN